MPATPTPTEPAQAAHQAAILAELIDLGTAIARRIEAATRPESAEPMPLHEAAPAFERVARAIRRTVLLARRLNETTQPPTPDPRTATRRKLIRAVEDSLTLAAPPPDQAASLHAEFQDRLDAPELDDDIATRPVADIINEICRDLGLADLAGFPKAWRRRTPADLATLHARAASPAKPRGRPGTSDRTSRPATPPPPH